MVDGFAVHGLPFANALSASLLSLPATDRTGIGELSISNMRAWSVAKVDEHRRYLALHAIHNILARIHRLPPEMLSRIFVEAWKDRKSLQLTHVCRLWRSLLLDTPHFWAIAIAGDEFRLQGGSKLEGVSDEDYLGAVCLRSVPRNISLRLSSISSSGHLQLIQHVDRITSMQICAYTCDQLELLWNVLSTGMPRLESLAIRVSASVREWAGPTKLSAEELPLLTRLTLPARLFCRAWPNTLEGISFRSDEENPEFYSPFMVSLDMVLKSLEDYQKLRVLDIRDSALFHDPHSRPPSCAFPTLERLRIRSEQGTVSAMLSLLTFPASTCLDIGLVPTRRLRQEDLFSLVPSLDAVVALIDQVAIHNASGSTSTIHGHTDGAERLRISGSSQQVAGTTHLFARTNAPVSRLLFTHHIAQRTPAAFMGQTIFPAFPHLTHLTLHGRTNVCGELLATLNWPVPSSSDLELGLLPLPLLTDLTVGFATKRRSEMSKELRRGGIRDDGAVATHFRECCRVFPGVLGGRWQRGSRLSRLEFFSYEEGCMTKSGSDPTVSHVDLAALYHNLVEREIERLQELVDGPVVFSGYRFFTQA